MEVVVQSHHAGDVSDRMRRRAEVAVSRIAERFGRTSTATIRFESDGPVRRVELMLTTPRRRVIVAKGEARRYYSQALSQALQHLQRQGEKVKRKRTARRNGTSGGR